MKSAPFDYILARDLDEATASLAEAGDEAMIIAGGQTLVPMMAMRLARPTLLVDINAIETLDGIEAREGGLVIGACTRQAAALKSAEIARRQPLLAKALPNIGHAQTRNRGTVGGSLALGDPAAEIPLVATTLDARVTLHNAAASREVPVSGFYDGPMMALREPDECLTQVHFPDWPEDGRLGTAFQEVNQRHGDFAIVAAAAQLLVDDGGFCRRAALALGGASPFPVRVTAAEEILTGNRPDAETIAAAVDCVGAAVDPQSDLHASADYRRRVAGVLAGRVLAEAAEDAQGRPQ